MHITAVKIVPDPQRVQDWGVPCPQAQGGGRGQGRGQDGRSRGGQAGPLAGGVGVEEAVM